MHGYELRKRLNLMLGWGRVLSYGSLYPTLKKMLRAHLIEEETASVTPVTRRPRIVYRVTEAGHREFERLMSEVGPTAWEDDNFDIRFAFFGRTDMEIRLRVLEGRRTRLQERLDRVQRELAMTQAEVDRYAGELQRHGVEQVEREVRWLSDLINAERNPANPTPESGVSAGAPPRATRTHLRTRKGALMGSVRVAIVGVGNCASSLVQGVEYYRNADASTTVPGLMHVTFGDYHVGDVEFVAAFDVDDKKVGKDLSEAINASENNTIKIADVPFKSVEVQRGPTLDGLGKYYKQTIEESAAEPVDVVKVLRDAEVDVLVSYLPVGSEEADKFYAQCAIDAKVAFVNALPVFIASDPEWAAKFEAAGVPIVGDDIKSQVGATITHRVMAKLFEDRGVALDRTYQLNVGGNMDFKNMLERERLESKKVSKTQAVTSNLSGELADKIDDKNVHIGPSDYVAWLDDRKWAYVRLEGRAFGDVPLNLEYKLEVWDSPNSAGIIIDAVRAAKIAKDRGIGGPIIPASAYLMKSPPVQIEDTEGRALLEKFIAGE